MKISVLTPSVRKEGLELVKKALDRQTFRDFEWIIGSSFDSEIGIWVKDDFTDGLWTLNRIYNKMIKQASGELIVSWQDFTYADPHTLEKFWKHHEDEPNTLVSGVGNKYVEVTPYPLMKLWQDPRERSDQGAYHECYFCDIEWNLCSCPKSALYEIGGFDEGMDYKFYGMDGYGVNERLSFLKKYKFKLDQTLKSYSLQHKRRVDWDLYNGVNGKYIEHRNELIAKKTWPELKYL